MRRRCLTRIGLAALGLAGLAAGMVPADVDANHAAMAEALSLPVAILRPTEPNLVFMLLAGLAITAGASGLTLLYLCGLRSLPRFDETARRKPTDATPRG